MTEELNKQIENQSSTELNNICEECSKEEESVFQNLILMGYKICNSCRILKTIFPL